MADDAGAAGAEGLAAPGDGVAEAVGVAVGVAVGTRDGGAAGTEDGDTWVGRIEGDGEVPAVVPPWPGAGPRCWVTKLLSTEVQVPRRPWNEAAPRARMRATTALHTTTVGT